MKFEKVKFNRDISQIVDFIEDESNPIEERSEIAKIGLEIMDRDFDDLDPEQAIADFTQFYNLEFFKENKSIEETIMGLKKIPTFENFQKSNKNESVATETDTNVYFSFVISAKDPIEAEAIGKKIIAKIANTYGFDETFDGKSNLPNGKYTCYAYGKIDLETQKKLKLELPEYDFIFGLDESKTKFSDFEYLCSCNNCGRTYIDTNPQVGAIKHEVVTNYYLELEDKSCPKCKTDSYLVDTVLDKTGTRIELHEVNTNEEKSTVNIDEVPDSVKDAMQWLLSETGDIFVVSGATSALDDNYHIRIRTWLIDRSLMEKMLTFENFKGVLSIGDSDGSYYLIFNLN